MNHALVSWLPRNTMSAAFVFAFGLCLGSFLNVVIHRLPRGLSLLHPGSHCPNCGHAVRPWHNLPVLGWLLLRGRCADCRVPIAVRYPLVEFSGGLLALAAACLFSSPVQSLAALWLFLSLLVVFFVDLEHRIIPDEVSLGGTILGLALSSWTIGLLSSVLVWGPQIWHWYLGLLPLR
jgi:leader peptidase (prepilin peptidase)/N-methyltransferase